MKRKSEERKRVKKKEKKGWLTTFGKKISTTPGTGFQMVAPLAMEALQWPVKMLNGRMLKSPVAVAAPGGPPTASGVVRPPPPLAEEEDEEEASAVKTTANMATTANREQDDRRRIFFSFFRSSSSRLARSRETGLIESRVLFFLDGR